MSGLHVSRANPMTTLCPGPSFIYGACCHASKAVYPPATDEQSLIAGILDLATHKACGMTYHYVTRWALTPPFHPYR